MLIGIFSVYVSVGIVIAILTAERHERATWVELTLNSMLWPLIALWAIFFI